MARVGVATTARRQEAGLIPEGRLTGPMPWVIAIMMFLTILAAAAGLALQASASRVNADLAGRVTVQIVEANPDARAQQRAAAERGLRSSAIVQHVETVSDAEIERLLAPWLGSEGFDNSIPIPAMIDIDLKEAASEASLTQLRAMLAEIAPSARVDAHGTWLRPLYDLLGSLQLLALALVLLLAFATSAAVLLSARAALNTHGETISILHLLGATDAQITRLFQRRIALDATFGGLLGFAAALALLLLIAAQAEAIGSGLLDSALLRWFDWAILVFIPFAGIVLAMLTARLAVMRALRKML